MKTEALLDLDCAMLDGKCDCPRGTCKKWGKPDLTDEQKVVRDLWTLALRGGAYRQGKYRLREGDEYCCLGVLCDLVDPHGWSANFHEHRERVSHPNADVCKAAGLTERMMVYLAGLNDVVGCSFQEIADVIALNKHPANAGGRACPI